MTCGHFLIPFWTFFGATVLGKAVVKVHIQAIFYIVVFNVATLEFLEQGLPDWMDDYIDAVRAEGAAAVGCAVGLVLTPTGHPTQAKGKFLTSQFKMCYDRATDPTSAAAREACERCCTEFFQELHGHVVDANCRAGCGESVHAVRPGAALPRVMWCHAYPLPRLCSLASLQR